MHHGCENVLCAGCVGERRVCWRVTVPYVIYNIFQIFWPVSIRVQWKTEMARSLTCKNETGSFSFRASMQNCNRDVVFCSLHVQLVTWSFNDRCLISLSCRTASISHCLRLSMDRISASHLASTCRSSSSHSPCNHEQSDPTTAVRRGFSSPN